MISGPDLKTLLQAELHNEPSVSALAFSEVVIDSREARDGTLFVALRGEHADGHQFVEDALARGASAALVSAASGLTGEQCVIVDDPLTALQAAGRRWRQRMPAQVIGITGSVGKTTVREAIYQLLTQHAPTHQSPRNYNGDIGLPIALLGIGPEHRWAVIEIGPYSQEEMELLVGMAQADVGIVTNVGPTHLERFGTLDDTERIKGLLPASLPSDGLAALNGDDLRVRRMAERTLADIVTFGQREDCDVQIRSIQARGFDGISVELRDHRAAQSVTIETPLIGAHQAMTVAAASAIGLHAGLTLDQIAASLGTLSPGSRLAKRRIGNGATIIDDAYNAAPLSMRAALELLSSCEGRRIALLGDMLELGSEEVAAHREIGEFAASRCDWLIGVGERSRELIAAARAAGHDEACWLSDGEQAVELIQHCLKPSDTLLVKASHGIHLERVVERLVAP